MQSGHSEPAPVEQPLPDLEDDIITIDYPTLEEESLITTFSGNLSHVVSVKVVKYLTKTSYLFMQTVEYTVKAYSSTGVVELNRSTQDLAWLSDAVKTNYPGIGVPINLIEVRYSPQEERSYCVQLFLNFLLNHQTLKFCPELQSFFLEDIQFLEYKSKWQSQKPNMPSLNSLSLRKMYNTLKQITVGKSTTDSKDYIQKLQLQQLMDYQKRIRETRDFLRAMLNTQTHNCDLEEQVLKNQQGILHKQQDCEDIKSQLEIIRSTFNKGAQSKRKSRTDEHLRVWLKLQVVCMNLETYIMLFDSIRELQQRIIGLKAKKEFGAMYEQERYLKLLTNNMKKDIPQWVSFNNGLLSEAIKAQQ